MCSANANEVEELYRKAKLINASGFPLGFEIFEVNKFEGHTLPPVIQSFKKKHTTAFAACVVYTEPERQLKNKNAELSPEKAIAILKTIYALTIVTPYSQSRYTRLQIKKMMSNLNYYNYSK
ncbi:MAG: hypothetical protein AUJ54_09490 [Ignavibacteria bacterium CG1_02_37_35]|nr:MAG: hypothetical protein AUJ54_09490 [Ignavibacteria bacterium CG1_02_37_35]